MNELTLKVTAMKILNNEYQIIEMITESVFRENQEKVQGFTCEVYEVRTSADYDKEL